MSGVLKFNGYTHATDSVGVRMQSSVIDNRFRVPFARIDRWTIIGAVKSDGSSGSLQTDIDALHAAYADGGQNYGDATYTANGNVHLMDDSASFSGVKVKGFGWVSGPWKMHTELSNRRGFWAVLEVEYRSNTGVYAYQEELVQTGTTLPKWSFMPSLVGLPEYQQLQLATTARYVQRGMLIHRTIPPVANASLFPFLNTHGDQTRFTRQAPAAISKSGSGQTEELYGVQWMYFGESSLPLTFGNFNTPAV
jgi:hypothetical protein